MMNDFLSDDFISKNIRVRPTSGKTFDEDREMKSHGSKTHINKGQQQEDSDENFQQAEF